MNTRAATAKKKKKPRKMPKLKTRAHRQVSINHLMVTALLLIPTETPSSRTRTRFSEETTRLCLCTRKNLMETLAAVPTLSLIPSPWAVSEPTW